MFGTLFLDDWHNVVFGYPTSFLFGLGLEGGVATLNTAAGFGAALGANAESDDGPNVGVAEKGGTPAVSPE